MHLQDCNYKQCEYLSFTVQQQVRFFLNDEAPSRVGLGIHDHLQAKTLTHPHAAATSSEENKPPGFEEVQAPNLSNKLLLEIPTIKWKRPPKVSQAFVVPRCICIFLLLFLLTVVN